MRRAAWPAGSRNLARRPRSRRSFEGPEQDASTRMVALVPARRPRLGRRRRGVEQSTRTRPASGLPDRASRSRSRWAQAAGVTRVILRSKLA